MKGLSSLGLRAAQVCEKEMVRFSIFLSINYIPMKIHCQALFLEKLFNDNRKLENFTKSGYES